MSHQREFRSSRPEVGQETNFVISCAQDGTTNHKRYSRVGEQTRCKWRRRVNHSEYIPMTMVIILFCSITSLHQAFIVIHPVSAVGGRRAQDVAALDELEEASSGLREAGGGGSSGLLEPLPPPPPPPPMTTNNENSDADGGNGSSPAQREAAGGSGDKMKNLDALLETLPVLSVGQKHSARFECELNNKNGGSATRQPGSLVKLVWVKLVRGQELASTGAGHHQLGLNQVGRDDIKLISLDQKLITPDRRFKVHKQAAYKWALTIDNVQPDDGNAYYLCQASAAEPEPAKAAAPNTVNSSSECKLAGGRATGNSSSSSDACQETSAQGRRPRPLASPEVARRVPATSSFVGGARLNVLAPPKIVENETSASLVLANEHEPLHLRCKVSGEPQSQLMWKREDNKQFDFDGVEQRFRHESQRKPNHHQILSIDSSELVFEPFLRSHSGAYLCIASNGIQAGVSQRINVVATNCRAHHSEASGNTSESCDKPAEPPGLRGEPETHRNPVTTVTLATITTTSDGLQSPAAIRKAWRTTSGRQQHQDSQLQSNPSKHMTKNRLLADKRRANGGRSNANSSSELQQQPTNGIQGQASIRQADSASKSNHGLQPGHLLISMLIYCTAACYITTLQFDY